MKIANESIGSDLKVSALILIAYILLYFVSIYLEYVVNNQINLNDSQIKTTKRVLRVAKFYNKEYVKKIARGLLTLLMVAISIICLAGLLSPWGKDIDISIISLLIILLGILINILRKYIILELIISRVEEYLKDLSNN